MVISYSITNSCGTVAATKTVTVKGCNVGIEAGPGPQPFDKLTMTIWPNPMRDEVVIAYNFDDDAVLEMRDIAGKIIATKKLSSTGQKETLDMHSFVPGIYLYRAVRNGVVVAQGKVVKM